MALKIARVTNHPANASFEKLGVLAFETGDLDGAASHFLAALERDDQNAGLFLKLGMVLLMQEKVDKALIAFKRTIELSPYDADAYNAMASCLFRLELWGAAEAFFARALSLEPAHATAKANLIETRKRLRSGDNPLPPEFDTIMALLESREPTLSLCMIAKNEEQFIGDCLRSVQGVANEIIVVDTGSSDRTVEIAERYGAKVHHFPWTGDFAAARNESLRHATSDWILVLDADETLAAETIPALKEALRSTETVGYSMVIDNLLGKDGESRQTALIFRLFRNRPDIRYEGIIHEQAMPSAQRTGLAVDVTQAKIVHRGYLNQYMEERGKVQRNLDILLKQRDLQPEEPYVHFNLAQTYKLGGDFALAEQAYHQSLSLLKAQNAPLSLAYYPGVYFGLSEIYRLTSRHEQGLQVAEEALSRLTASPDIKYSKGLHLIALERYEEAIACFKECRNFQGTVMASGNDPFVATYKAALALAVAYSNLGDLASAKSWLETTLAEEAEPNAEARFNLGRVHMREGEWAAASERFEQVTVLSPDYAEAWLHVGKAKYQLRAFGEAVEAWRKARELDLAGFDVDDLFGEALLRTKAATEAADAFARHVEQREASPTHWILLGMARLCAGDAAGAHEAWLRLGEIAGHGGEASALEGLSRASVTGEEAEWQPEGLQSKRRAELGVTMLEYLLVTERYAEVENVMRAMQAERDVTVLLEVGRFFVRMGLHDEALGFLLKAREADAENAEVYAVLGLAAEAKGEIEDARVMYQMALSLNPQYVVVRQQLANLRAPKTLG